MSRIEQTVSADRPPDWPYEAEGMYFRLVDQLLGTLNLACDQGYVVRSYTFGHPTTRAVMYPNALDDGVYDVTKYIAERAVSIDLTLKARASKNDVGPKIASEAQLRDNVRGFLHPQRRPRLIFTEHDDSRCRQILLRGADSTVAFAQPRYNAMSASWIAPRAYIESYRVHIVTVTIDQDIPGFLAANIENEGNAPAYWSARFQGEVIKPRLTLDNDVYGTSTLQLDIPLTQPGDVITVDSFTHAVMVNDKPVGFKYVDDQSDWFRIPPGTSRLRLDAFSTVLRGYEFGVWTRGRHLDPGAPQAANGQWSDRRPNLPNPTPPNHPVGPPFAWSLQPVPGGVPGAVLAEAFNNYAAWDVTGDPTIEPGRTGTAARLTGAGDSITYEIDGGTSDYITLGFAFTMDTLDGDLLFLRGDNGNGTEVEHNRVHILADGTIQFLRRTVPIATSLPALVTASGFGADQQPVVANTPTFNAARGEAGVTYGFDADGRITRLRYQRLAGFPAALTLRVWRDSDHSKLAEVTDTQTTAGAFEVTLPEPIAVTAGDTWTVTYSAVVAGSTEFPTVAAVSSEVGTAMGADRTIAAPAGVSPGDLLIGTVTLDSATIPTAVTSWTQISARSLTTAVHQVVTWGRIADGTAADAFIVSGTANNYAASMQRITSHGVTAIADIKRTGTTSETDAPINPPSLDTGSLKKWLWLTVGACDEIVDNSITAVPVNYTQAHAPLSSLTTALAVATRALEAQIEDPGVFTNIARPWMALTLAIPPAPTAPAVPANPTFQAVTPSTNVTFVQYLSSATPDVYPDTTEAATSFYVEPIFQEGQANWNYLEVQAYLKNFGGWVKVMLNDTEVINATGLDTSSGFPDAFYTMVRFQTSDPRIIMVDDLYVKIGEDANFAGDVQIEGDTPGGSEIRFVWCDTWM